MNIFVDEAGVFVVPQKSLCAVSCVGALVLPEVLTEEILEGFSELKNAWGISGAEVKGSRLGEREVSSLIKFLSGYDILFQVTAIDMNMQTNPGLTNHRLLQAAKLLENLTDQHSKALVQQVHELKEFSEKMQSQLYVQAACTFELLYKVIQKATLYYSQRLPEELSEFYWSIDAKDKEITPYEDFWTKVVLGALQSKSFREPFIQLGEADYSYFEKYLGASPYPPEHLKDAVEEKDVFQFVSINDVYQKHLSFEQSYDDLGVQLVDILTTATRRAMNGTLQIEGWGGIGRLMVQSERGAHAIQLIDLTDDETFSYSKEPPYWAVMAIADRRSKAMLVD